MTSKNFKSYITGQGIISPSGRGISPLWNDCLNRESRVKTGLGRLQDSDLNFIKEFIKTSAWVVKQPREYSKSLFLSLYAIITAVESAGWQSFKEDDVLFIGTTTGQLSIWEKSLIDFWGNENNDPEFLNKFSKQSLAALEESIREVIGFKGKIHIISSACSASTQAFGMAHEYLRSARAKRVIVGGVEELGDLTIKGFGCLKLLASSPCTPFDENRGGINLSEGAAFYTLETQANSDICFYGGDTYLDSYHMTSPHPEGRGHRKAISKTLSKAGIEAKDIGFIHAHGTASFHNDQAESASIEAIFGTNTPVISTKGVHGHALGASGAIEMAICIEVLKSKKIPAVCGLKSIDPSFNILLPLKNQDLSINYLLKSTLGFGGINSTFIIGRAINA